MTRKLKLAGAATLAILAISIMSNPSANAAPAHFTADGITENVLFTGSAKPGEPHQEFVTMFGSVDCNKFAFDGTSTSTADTLTATAVTYSSFGYFEGSSKCEGFGLEAAVEFNGCDYRFHLGETEWGGVSTGTVDLLCPVQKSVQIVTPTCTVTIPAQSGLGPVWFEADGGTPEDLRVFFTIEGFNYSGKGATCSGSSGSGTYEGEATLKVYEDLFGTEGSQVEATITST